MDESSQENGHQNGKVYVKFGPRPTEEISIEWASGMLTLWKEKKPVEFGRYLAEVVTGGR
jgi:hypothetical protein